MALVPWCKSGVDEGLGFTPVYMKAELVSSPAHDRNQEVCRDHSLLCSLLINPAPCCCACSPQGLAELRTKHLSARSSCSISQLSCSAVTSLSAPGLSSSTHIQQCNLHFPEVKGLFIVIPHPPSTCNSSQKSTKPTGCYMLHITHLSQQQINPSTSQGTQPRDNNSTRVKNARKHLL